MTEEKKKGTAEKSRREFLKDAGSIVGGVAIGSTILLAACGVEEITKTVTTTAPGGTTTVTDEVTKTVDTTTTVEVPVTFPLSEGYIVVDSNRCSACMTCALTCSLVHEGKQGTSLSRIQVLTNEFGRFPTDTSIRQCRQCVYPVCVEACPTGACHVDTANGNVRVIDESLCTGCGLCLAVCPQIPHRTVWDSAESKVTKCDLCDDTPFWSEKGGPGGKQACVEVCPWGALKFVSETPIQQETLGYDIDLAPKV